MEYEKQLTYTDHPGLGSSRNIVWPRTSECHRAELTKLSKAFGPLPPIRLCGWGGILACRHNSGSISSPTTISSKQENAWQVGSTRRLKCWRRHDCYRLIMSYILATLKGLVKPKIRFTSRWMERAGFPPGQRVEVIVVK